MLTIRTVAPSELRELVELYGQIHPPEDPRPRATADEPTWSRILAHPGLSVFVGELDGRLVTSCTLVVVPNLTSGARPYAVLENVVTHPDYQRNGYGAAVIRHALAAAWAANCYKVMLQTGSKVDATLRFYEGVGLVRGRTTGFAARSPTA